MSDLEEFLHDLNKVIDVLKDLERCNLDYIERDKLYEKVIIYQENLDYFIDRWSPKKEEE